MLDRIDPGNWRAGAGRHGRARRHQRGAGWPRNRFPVGTTTILIVGETDVFPVRKVIHCIGAKNWRWRCARNGLDPNREPPFFFQKPTDAIQNMNVQRGAVDPPCTVDWPRTTIMRWNWSPRWKIRWSFRPFPLKRRWSIVFGYALGLDTTRRDLQRAMGDEKKPMEIGKSFRFLPLCSGRYIRQPGPDISPRARFRYGERHGQAEFIPRNMMETASRSPLSSEARTAGRTTLFGHAKESRRGPVVKGDAVVQVRRSAAWQHRLLTGHFVCVWDPAFAGDESDLARYPVRSANPISCAGNPRRSCSWRRPCGGRRRGSVQARPSPVLEGAATAQRAGVLQQVMTVSGVMR